MLPFTKNKLLSASSKNFLICGIKTLINRLIIIKGGKLPAV
ncbi:hypothetical protein E2C01_076279 [Portunus trituberculatus]|uniref:Uncharacterized protein n=1 Tax=Portunus trituberculatus TaxID=210409 RepID=A0A5B7I8C2_PORTR|nr:hypothetical protein [Portunus trituberculatus]